MTLLASRCQKIDTENAFKIGPKIAEVEAGGNPVIKCNLGEPDFPVPSHIREELKRQIDADNAHYCDPQGIPPLRKAIAAHLSESRAIPITPEQVVVFPGAKPPIGLCQQTYTDPGDEVLYPSPGFPIYESFVRYVDAIPVPLHLQESKGFTLDASDLAPHFSDKSKLLFLNFPSNPTGGVASQNQLEDLADAIKRHAPGDMRVYSDEVYEDILFDGATHRSIASVDGMAARTIIVSGVSKSFSWTGGRIGWAAFPTVEEAQIFKNLNINYFSCVAPYNQEGAREALTSPQSAPRIAEMVAAFEERRDVVVDGLNNLEGIECQKPGGAFYVFPNIGGACKSLGVFDAYDSLPGEQRAATSPSTMFQMFLLYRYHVATVERRSFGRIGTDDMHFIRLSIATAMDELRDAVSRIGEAAGDRAGFAEFVTKGENLC